MEIKKIRRAKMKKSLKIFVFHSRILFNHISWHIVT